MIPCRPPHRKSQVAIMVAAITACILPGIGVAGGPKKAETFALPTRDRTLEQIEQALAKIAATPDKETDAVTAAREAALRRLKCYRYLVGIPHENVILDDKLNQFAAAAAGICEKLGRLDHTPPNPGLSEEEYKLARAGAGMCNLSGSFRGDTLVQSIDLYMDDSDEANIDRVGHRRWCLHPLMRKVGFGQAGTFMAMAAQDRSQSPTPKFDVVAYPCPGLMPLQFFDKRRAWSISLNPTKYAIPAGGVEVSIVPAPEPGDAAGPPLRLDNVRVDRGGYGIPNCIIFRPDKDFVAVGKKYLVEVKGIVGVGGKKLPPLQYPVEFVRLQAPPQPRQQGQVRRSTTLFWRDLDASPAAKKS